jgi:hypothetical protein
MKSLPGYSNQILLGNPDITERNFGSIRRPDTQFVFQFGRLEAFAIRLHHDDTKSFVRLRVWFRDAKNRKVISNGPTGDERLGTIDDIFITIQNSTGFNGGNITSRVWLGNGKPVKAFPGSREASLLPQCRKENHF